jgi:hypothetical protein
VPFSLIEPDCGKGLPPKSSVMINTSLIRRKSFMESKNDTFTIERAD